MTTTLEPIHVALVLLLVHGALGAFDTFYNHEWRERLPSRASASKELALHSARSAVFVVTFAGLAWFEWHGAWGWVALGIIGLEYVITLFDSVEEDRTRKLSGIERTNHMLLGLNTGLYAAFVTLQVVTRWRHEPGALVPTHYPVLSWLLTACAAAILVWTVRDGHAAWRQAQARPHGASGAEPRQARSA